MGCDTFELPLITSNDCQQYTLVIKVPLHFNFDDEFDEMVQPAKFKTALNINEGQFL